MLTVTVAPAPQVLSTDAWGKEVRDVLARHETIRHKGDYPLQVLAKTSDATTFIKELGDTQTEIRTIRTPQGVIFDNARGGKGDVEPRPSETSVCNAARALNGLPPLPKKKRE